MATFPFTGDNLSQIEMVYIGYFGRGGDPTGTTYWETSLYTGMSINQIAASFSVQAEAQAEYSLLAYPLLASTPTYASMSSSAQLATPIGAFLNSVYGNLFGRAADAAGLTYWGSAIQTALATGNATTIATEVGIVVLQIALGASTAADQGVLAAKVTLADYLTTTLAADNITFTNNGSALDVYAKTIIATITPSNYSASAISTAESAITTFIATPGNVTGTTYTLTTGQDTLSTTSTGAIFYGTLGTTGATLQGFDSLSGVSGSTAILSITDASANTLNYMLMPAGLTLSNIPNITVITAYNAGSAAAPAVFDVSLLSGVTQLTVTSSGNVGDDIKAASTTSVTDTSYGTTENAIVIGGKNITFTTGSSGSVTIGTAAGTTEPTGAVVVSDTSTGGAAVAVYGGTTVSVTTSGTGNVTVGNGTVATDPSSTVTITDTSAGAGNIVVKGGTAVTVTNSSTGTIGIGGTAIADPSGAIIVNQGATATGAVTIDGGSSVTVGDLGGTGAINIGTNVAETGAVTVTENSVLSGGAAAAVTIYGGTIDTVTTSGGNVKIGDGATAANAPTGAVSVTDTFSGPNVDTLKVYGGTTVGITTTADSGNITVGGAVAYDPTGNVTIVNKEASFTTAGVANTTYGTATTAVHTNGSAAVSVTGGAVTITDDGTGTPSLATVSLTGITGASSVVENAGTSTKLTTLNITSNTTAAATVTVTGLAGTRTLALNLVGDTSTGAITDANATTLNITNATTASTGVNVVAAAATTVSVTSNAATTFNPLNIGAATSLAIGGTALTTITALTAGSLTSITVTGTGGYTNTNGIPTNVTSITGTGYAAPVTVGITPANTSFAGGTGVNTVSIIGAVGGGPSPTVNGGGNAASEIDINYAAGGVSLAANSHISGFSILGLDTVAGNYGGAAASAGTYDATGFTGLKVYGGGNIAYTFSNVANGTPVSLIGSNTSVVTLQEVAGTTTQTINLGNATSGSATEKATTAASVLTDSIVSNGASGATNTFTLAATGGASITTINISGSAALTLNDTDTAATAVTTIDAHLSSGAISTTGVTLNTATGTTIIGGSGVLTANGGVTTAAVRDVITVGTGGGTIGIGRGGAVTSTATYSSGSETINLGNETVASQLTNYDSGSTGDYATINGWHVTSSTTTADKLVLTNAGTAIADVAAGTASGIGGTTYGSTNGIITFAGGSPTLLQEVNATAVLVTASGASKIAAFQYTTGGVTSTYVVQADTGADGSDNVQALVGENATLYGFANTGVGTTAVTGAGSILANVTGVTSANTGTLHTGGTISATGDGVFTITNTASDGTLVVTNLANWGTINDASASGTTGVETVTQLGTGAALVYNSTGAHSLASLTVTNTATLELMSGAATTFTSIVDGSASATTLTEMIIGADTGGITISGITASGLTTLDATAATVTPVITDNLAGQTISLATGIASTVTAANGAADHITQAAGAGAITITSASGAGDVISILSTAAGGSSITASGAGDSFTTGTGAFTIAAAGTGDTVVFGVAGSAQNVTVGGNATATFSATHAGAETLIISADPTGALSSGTISMTTLKAGVDGTDDQVTILPAGVNQTNVMGHVYAAGATSLSTGLVNVSSATSLANAYDLVAATVMANGVSPTPSATNLTEAWFQYGGNTYIEGITGASHSTTALGTGDFVVEVVGLVNLGAGGTLTGASGVILL